MKRLFTQRVILASLLLFTAAAVSAQPDHIFKNPSLKSGTDLSVGAVYKFTGIKAGVDANITVLNATGGVTLSSIDENWTGFDEAFQPFIHVAPNADGYVEFRVDFLQAGTETLLTQAVVNTTCIDVDGVGYWNGALYERDQVELKTGYYDFTMTGSNLQVLNPPGWISIRNTSGTSYDGIDTTQKDVMATVTNLNISSFKIRIGAYNSSPTKSEVRYRSVYFKKFNYPSSILLPNRTTLNFSGAWKGNAVQLNGTLSASHTFDKMLIERSNPSGYFTAVGELTLAQTSSSEYPFTFTDLSAPAENNYYRLRLINTNQRIQELSSIILVKKGEAIEEEIKLTNTLLSSSNPVLTISSRSGEEASIQAADLSGRLVYSGKFRLNPGSNNISLNHFNARTGYFVIVVKTKNASVSRKLYMQ